MEIRAICGMIADIYKCSGVVWCTVRLNKAVYSATLADSLHNLRCELVHMHGIGMYCRPSGSMID